MDRRQQRGVAFETEVRAILRQVKDSELVESEATWDARVEQTLAAIAAGRSLVIAGQLPTVVADHRSGAPDVLVRTTDGYVAVEIKHHKALAASGSGRDPALISSLHSPDYELAQERPQLTARNRRSDLLQLAH